MTWNDLQAFIAGLTDEQRDTNVTVYINDEYLPVCLTAVSKVSDVLDEDHPYLECN